MLGFAALGRIALGRFKQGGVALALSGEVGALALGGSSSVARVGLPAPGGATTTSGHAATFAAVWRAGDGSCGLAAQDAVLRATLAGQPGGLGATDQVATFSLTLAGAPAALALGGPGAYLSKTTPGGGDGHTITFRAGGPAFTRRRYRRMRKEQAAQAAAAREAEQRADIAARASRAAAAARAAEALQRRRDEQDRAAAVIQAALAQRHAQQGLAGARALTGIGRDAGARMAVAGQVLARIHDDDEALALLLAA